MKNEQLVSNSCPTISIITVVFNASALLRQTIKSVSSSSYFPHIEYIIIDGGSTDGTIEVIKEHQEKIAHWVSEPDTGIYDAMNKGIRACSGKWIYFLNAGDELHVNFNNHQSLLSQNFALIYAKARYITKGGHFLTTLGAQAVSDLEQFYFKMPICHQAILYHRDYIRAYDCSYKVIADKVMTYQIFKNEGFAKAYFVDEYWFDYHEGGFSAQNKERILLEERLFLMNHQRYSFKNKFWYTLMLSKQIIMKFFVPKKFLIQIRRYRYH